MDSQYYTCPGPHDGSLQIWFDKILMVYNREQADILNPSVKNPASYKHLQLVQKSLAWSSADIIKCWNKEDSSDAVIYIGKWSEQETTIINTLNTQ